MYGIRLPLKYVPKNIKQKERKKQWKELMKSRKMYKKNLYYTRKNIPSYSHKTSKHILRARKIYNVDTIVPNKELSIKTGCTIDAMNQIVKKGEGAYYSSGSRPNQTAQSWGIARLAGSITGSKAAAVDYNILEKGCQHNKKAFKLAKISRKKNKFGKRHTFRIQQKNI
jgi:hypothetical protein